MLLYEIKIKIKQFTIEFIDGVKCCLLFEANFLFLIINQILKAETTEVK